MDIYDYNEDHISTVAENCRYLSCRQPRRSDAGRTGISCVLCNNWNGSDCTRKQFDRITSELQLD